MDELYKIVKQLSEAEFQDIYQNLTSTKADKSALFLETIRTSDNPVEDFLKKQDISASAFYVLKSRLNQKIEGFLLNRLGDPKMEAIHKVFKVNELIFNSPREISVTTLNRLEKTMVEADNPLVLMVVYRALKMLHTLDDDARNNYDKLYNQAVAFYLTTDKAQEAVLTFFRLYDRYSLGKREKDYAELLRTIEKIHNINNLYQSQRLFICKAIIHLFARQFLDMNDRVTEIMDPEEVVFERSFETLEKNPDDILFKNLNLLFDYLRYCYFRKQGIKEKEQIYYDLLDYKIEELLTGFNFGMDCSGMLFFKLEKHIAENSLDKLNLDIEKYIRTIHVDTYRVVTYVNFYLFLAYAAFLSRNYDEAARILYRIRNEVNFRKLAHVDAEIKLFLSLCYILQGETDLANQLVLSLQRQLKKSTYAGYDNARMLLKILANRMGGNSPKKFVLLKKYILEFQRLNTGKYKIIPYVNISLELFISNMGK